MFLRPLLFSLLLCFPFAYAVANDLPPQQMTPEAFEASLTYRQGEIELPGGKATLDVPAGFRYLGPEDAERVLVDAWGNPPGSGALGMLFPASVGPLSDESWGVVITYTEDGHVSDEEADQIDYAELLTTMQENTAANNEERERQGYGRVDLVGWAEPPHYDKAEKKLYWAKELRFGNSAENSLNYCIRILGRQGVLELNAVAGMEQLPAIRQAMPSVLAFTNFSDGNRYADFNADTDKVAAYGLATLIGGAAAAKMGLFAKLLALLVAGKKIVIAGLVAAGAVMVRLFRKKDSGSA